MHSPTNPVFIGGTNYLMKTCDGTNTASGQMSIKSSDFNGNILIITNNAGTVGVDRCEYIIRNTNSFDLHLRIVLTGSNNNKVVSTNPIIIPAGSPWQETFFPIYSSAVLTPDPGVYVDDVLANVVEIEIIHSVALATQGEVVTGTLEIDQIGFRQLLSVEDKFLQDIKVFPNPVVDQLFIDFPTTTKGTLSITSIDGKQLLSQEFITSQMKLDMSSIKSKGIYFLKIETPSGTLTKKIVKG